MKTTLLALSFFLFALTTKSLLGVVDAELAPVLDLNGEELRTGTSYYILPAIARLGIDGGITLAPTRHNTCPVEVAQDSGFSKGIPSIFLPLTYEEDGVVRVMVDLNIKFSITENCNISTVWKLEDTDELTGKNVLTTGGVKGNPGLETLSNWFRIQQIGSVYKISHCPAFCMACRTLCGDIGIYKDPKSGIRHMALSDTPFLIVFDKAETTSIGKSII